MAETSKIKMRAAELLSATRKDRAEEVRAYAQALLFLAQAKKAEGDKDLAWLDQQMQIIRQHFEVATTMFENGQMGGPAPDGDAGGNAAGA
jgi:hypothetical protein